MPASFAPIFVEPSSSRKGEKGDTEEPEKDEKEQDVTWFVS